MNQPSAKRLLGGFAVFLAVVCGCGCDKRAPQARGSHQVRVASLVPAGTDLMVAIGASDLLVGVSTYDTPRPGIEGLPRVGDYQNLDTEKLRQLHPNLLLIFQAPDRVGPQLKEFAQEQGIKLMNVSTETLADVYAQMKALGEAVHRPEAALRAVEDLHSRLSAVQRAHAGEPRVRTLLVRDEKAQGVVGAGTFLDELLAMAGGQNVMTAKGWPDIDRERLRALAPDAVVILLCDASPQVEAAARSAFDTMPDLPAVKNHQIHLINKWYALQAGSHIADMAKALADALHPAPASQPAPHPGAAAPPVKGADKAVFARGAA